MSEGGITIDDSANRAAGRQLLIFGLIALLGLTALLFVLNALAGFFSSGTTTNTAVDVANNTITIYIREEPPQLDSSLQTDQVSGMVIGHVIEGLLSRDQFGNLAPGMAERWEVTPTEATFWIREDAVWSNGTPVTAHDFVFAWRKVVDPQNASEYAFLLYYIKNGEAINNNEMPIEALGVEAIDDKTLHVTLERPVPFFDKLVAFSTYRPINEAFYNSTNGRYGADADEMLYNGPFTMESWVHGASIFMKKNPNYWNKERVKLDAINIGYITADGNATLNFFKDDKVVYANLQPENLGEALAQRWKIKRFQDGSVFFMEFNHRPERLTRSLHLRKALQYVTDSDELVNNVIKLPGYLPGRSLFPVYIKGVESEFRKEHPAPPHMPNLAEAKRHLELAKEELGVDEIPPLTMLTGDNPISNVQAEYFQGVFKSRLGLDVRIDKQIFKQRIAKMLAGDFDMVLAGWGPDFDDALTFGDLFASWNLNNRGRYDNPEYDQQIRIAQNSLDPEVRMKAFARVQEIIYEDAVILPHYERGMSYVIHPQLKGLVRRVVGADPDFTFSYIASEAEEG